MVTITYNKKSYQLEEDESVLNCLLRVGIDAPYSCLTGVCQTCRKRATTESILPEESQSGLKDSLKVQGYFLACSCYPTQDIEIIEDEEALYLSANIIELTNLSPSIIRIRIKPAKKFKYESGQFINLLVQNNLARNYSLASLPDEDFLELHARKIPNGKMSDWLANQAKSGDEVQIQGPFGNCFYTSGNPSQPLILAGTGTGLAPLYGILRTAISSNHNGPIWLFHGARTPSGLYLTEELYSIAQHNNQVTYIPNVLVDETHSHNYKVGTIDTIILNLLPKLTGWRAFLCGDPEIVNLLKKQFFLAGISSKDIFADPFLPNGS